MFFTLMYSSYSFCLFSLFFINNAFILFCFLASKFSNCGLRLELQCSFATHERALFNGHKGYSSIQCIGPNFVSLSYPLTIGTVRRSTDNHIIHANIDTDLIIAEEPPFGGTAPSKDLVLEFSVANRQTQTNSLVLFQRTFYTLSSNLP